MKLTPNEETPKRGKKIKHQVYVSPVHDELLREDGDTLGLSVSEVVRSIIMKHYEGRIMRI